MSRWTLVSGLETNTKTMGVAPRDAARSSSGLRSCALVLISDSQNLVTMASIRQLMLLSAYAAGSAALVTKKDDVAFDPLDYVDPLIGSANGGMNIAPVYIITLRYFVLTLTPRQCICGSILAVRLVPMP